MSEDYNWDKADQDFFVWLSGRKAATKNELSKILKSTYLVFRRKQKEKLEILCKSAYEYLKEKESTKGPFSDHKIRYQFPAKTKEELEEIERNKIAQIKNISYPGNESKIILPKDYSSYTNAISNKEILSGILSNNQVVYYDLYENQFPKIARLILDNNGTVENAKDIFQDALVILLEKVRKQEFELTCYIGSFLYAVCKNIWFSKLREKNAFVNYILGRYKIDKSDYIILQDESEPDLIESISTAIDLLGDPCKQLLENFYYHNLNWDEIARSLGYSNAASARNQKYKCLERIKITLDVKSH